MSLFHQIKTYSEFGLQEILNSALEGAFWWDKKKKKKIRIIHMYFQVIDLRNFFYIITHSFALLVLKLFYIMEKEKFTQSSVFQLWQKVFLVQFV